MPKIEVFFKTDPLWNEVKTSIKRTDDKKLTKIEFLKQVGARGYTAQGYKNYIKQWEQEHPAKQQELL